MNTLELARDVIEDRISALKKNKQEGDLMATGEISGLYYALGVIEESIRLEKSNK